MRITKRLLVAVVFSASLVGTANAQDASVALDAGPGDVSVGDRAGDLEDAIAGAREDGPEPKHLAWAGVIASGLWLLFAVVKNRDYFPIPKKRIPLVVGVIGLLAAGVEHYATGDGWLAAVIVGGGAFGAVVIQQIFKAIKGDD